ncbi:MAG: SpoIIE family protein phosphatase [Chloroflexota bacterium]
MGLLIDIGVAKTNKYATRESGDTVEIVERPAGGLTVVIADGQGSGRAAKTLSQMAASRAVEAIKHGARDEAAAALVNDHLRAYRHGQVSASVTLLSFDLAAGMILAARFGDGALGWRAAGGDLGLLDAGPPAGLNAGAEPALGRWPLAAGWAGALCTDGIVQAGRRTGEPAGTTLLETAFGPGTAAQQAADEILGAALALDGGKPGDDMAIVVALVSGWDGDVAVRRMGVQVQAP